MSTAIDFRKLKKAISGASKPSSNSSSSSQAPNTQFSGVSGKFSFSRRPNETKSIADAFQVSPEGLERAFYVPNFISEEEEQFAIQQKIYATKDVPAESSAKWVSLSHRRLKVYGGIPDSQSTFMKPLPAWIDEFLSECVEPLLAATPPLESGLDAALLPNHVLLNEYSGGMGIAPHFDGPLYHQRVVVLNLQSPAVMWFYHVKSDENSTLEKAFNVVLEPRSLIIFEGSLYTQLKHGIENSPHDDLTGQQPPSNLKHLSDKTRRLLADTCILSRGELPRLSLTLRRIKNEGTNELDISTKTQQDDLKRREAIFYRNVSELN